jgi:hypothetical protein
MDFRHFRNRDIKDVASNVFNRESVRREAVKVLRVIASNRSDQFTLSRPRALTTSRFSIGANV